jgi:hypothetical protein
VKRVPWKQVLDVAIGVAEIARGPDTRDAGTPQQQLTAGTASSPGHIEARLAGVVVAALREAFDRDTRRLELEREQVEAERIRADRALALERSRQAAEREIGRLRLVAGVAVASWLGTLLFATRLLGSGIGVRMTIAIGWMLMFAALAASFAGQAQIAHLLDHGEAADGPRDQLTSGLAGALAPWMVVAGLAVIAVALIIF